MINAFKDLFAEAVSYGTNYVPYRVEELAEKKLSDTEVELLNKVGGVIRFYHDNLDVMYFDMSKAVALAKETEDKDFLAVMHAAKDIFDTDQEESLANFIEYTMHKDDGEPFKVAFWANPMQATDYVVKGADFVKCFMLSLDNIIEEMSGKYEVLNGQTAAGDNWVDIDNVEMAKDVILNAAEFDDACIAFIITVRKKPDTTDADTVDEDFDEEFDEEIQTEDTEGTTIEL